MKKLLLFGLISFVLFISFSSSEERSPMDILTSYKWNIHIDSLKKSIDPDFPDMSWATEVYMLFSKTSMTASETWSDDDPDEVDRETFRYYLGKKGVDVIVDEKLRSDGIYYTKHHPVKFDSSKVGKNKTGDYIIVEIPGEEYADLLWIIELTEDKLVIYPIGGRKWLVYEALPKD